LDKIAEFLICVIVYQPFQKVGFSFLKDKVSFLLKR